MILHRAVARLARLQTSKYPLRSSSTKIIGLGEGSRRKFSMLM